MNNYQPYDGHAPSQKHSATSIAAGAAIEKKIGPLHRRILAYLKERNAGSTDEAMCDDLDMGGNTLRPRRRELQLQGRIVDSGRVSPTKSGRSAVVWVLS